VAALTATCGQLLLLEKLRIREDCWGIGIGIGDGENGVSYNNICYFRYKSFSQNGIYFQLVFIIKI